MFGNDFYPTPGHVVIDMVSPYMHNDKRPRDMLTILEPSAGKGDIIDKMIHHYNLKFAQFNAIEKNPELRATLTGKGYKVIDSDFLKFNDPMHFDLVVMNPPFREGATHLLRAWELVADGGDIVCLLNAETLRNPYTEERKLLISIIEEHGVTKDIGNPFNGADSLRKTEVEVVLVRLHKPEREGMSFDGVVVDHDVREAEADFQVNPLASANMIESLVAQYERARDVLRQIDKLRAEYHYYAGAAKLPNYEQDDNEDIPTLNDQITVLKARFWKFVFDKTQIGQLTTSDFQRKFYVMREQTAMMAFTVDNVMAILEMFVQNRGDILQQCIESVFDAATAFHYKNCVHVEGWKTNKSWKVNKTIIIPGVVDTSYGYWSMSLYRRREFFEDIDKVCCYLSGLKLADITPLKTALENRVEQIRRGADYTEVFETAFFQVRVYKKGTMHLTFKDLDLLARFNQAAAKRKGWQVGPGY